MSSRRRGRSAALPVSWNAATADEVLKVWTLFLSDFRFAVDCCTRMIGYETDPVQTRMAAFVGHFPKERRLLLAARGWTKTWIMQVYVCWRLARNPHMKVMIISATLSHAKKFLRGIRMLLRIIPFFQHLDPRCNRFETAVRTKTAIDVGPCVPATDPSVGVYGMETQITGAHVDLIVPDDIEIPKNSNTQAKREQLHETISEFDRILNPGGDIVGIGTFQNVQSVYRRFLESQLWAYVTVPALDEHDQSTFASKFTTEYLHATRDDAHPGYWALQMMLSLDIQGLENNPIKRCNLIQAESDRVALQLFIDPSGATGNDEVGYCVAGIHEQINVYYQEVGGILGESPAIGQHRFGKPLAPASPDEEHMRRANAICTKLCDVVEQYKIAQIHCESNMPGYAWFKDTFRRQLYQRRLQVAIRDHKAEGNKHARIVGTLKQLSETGRMWLHPEVLADEQTCEQFDLLTYDELPPLDDRIDVMEQAADILAKRMQAPKHWRESTEDDYDHLGRLKTQELTAIKHRR